MLRSRSVRSESRPNSHAGKSRTLVLKTREELGCAVTDANADDRHGLNVDRGQESRSRRSRSLIRSRGRASTHPSSLKWCVRLQRGGDLRRSGRTVLLRQLTPHPNLSQYPEICTQRRRRPPLVLNSLAASRRALTRLYDGPLYLPLVDTLLPSGALS